MEILNPHSLREAASHALARGRDPKRLIRSFACINLVLSVFVVLLDLWLEQEISGTGGLGNLGTRAILSTAQQAVPMLRGLLAVCLEAGYLSGMMRIARGQYADHTDLKTGLQKFWPLMRLALLQFLIQTAVAILAAQIATTIFLMTPMSQPALDAAAALSTADPAALTEADVFALLDAMLPMYPIFMVVYPVAIFPFLFRMRMALYCLLDDPQGRALAAIRDSNQMMKKRLVPMLKVDLGFWPYYLGLAVIMLVSNMGLILTSFGITVPMDADLFFLLLQSVIIVLEFVLYITLRNRVEATYLTAYDRLREKPQGSGPVVLGNIFDM